MLRRNVRGPGRYTFGRVLRELRRRHNCTIAVCAARLEVAKSLWTEVELGNHEPFNDLQIAKIEKMLALHPDQSRRLRIAAATTRGCVTLPIGQLSDAHRELAIVLAQQWKSLTPAQVNTIGLLLTSDGLPD